MHVDQKLIDFLTFLPMFLISITIHEFAHAFVAFKKGDSTAKDLGRLTLNPIKHADIVGTFIMPLASFATGFALIGWAKPVPVNRNNLPSLKADALVSAAGPFSNIILAAFFYVIFLAAFHAGLSAMIINICWYGVFFNIFLALFNLIPVPPLDGSHILFDLFPNKYTAMLLRSGLYGSFILLFLIYSPLWQYFMNFITYILSFLLSISGLRNA